MTVRLPLADHSTRNGSERFDTAVVQLLTKGLLHMGCVLQWKIALSLGWVPAKADREDTYEHLNRCVPDNVKFDLHVLLVRYGKEVRMYHVGVQQYGTTNS